MERLSQPPAPTDLFNILNQGVCYDQFCETFIKNYYETGVSQQIDVYLLSRASLTET